MLPFARLKLEAPATAVSTPPQVFVAVGGAAITIPSGRLSASAVVVSASAFAAALTKPSVVVTAPAAIVFVPEPAPAGVVMFTEIVHEVAPAASAPPASEKLPAPGLAVTAPPQVLATFGVVETT